MTQIQNDARSELKLQQEQFLDALLGLAPCPAELDAKQVQTCGNSLINKRSRYIENVLSSKNIVVTADIKAELLNYFKKYASVHTDGFRADAKRFLAYRRTCHFMNRVRTKFRSQSNQ